MAHYRISILENRGGISYGVDAICPSDSAALAHARTLLDSTEKAEVWRGERLVGRTSGDDPPRATDTFGSLKIELG